MADSPIAPHPHPFRPRLSLRVGVTGHRWDKLKLDDGVAIGERFEQVFETIERIADRILTDPRSGYRDPLTPPEDAPAPLLRIFSGLAEGTDRLGADAALRRNGRWTLTAMLPFARETFELDFQLKKMRPNGTAVAFAEGEPEYKQPDPESIRAFRVLLATAEREGGVQELNGVKGTAGGAYAPLANAICLNSDLVIAVWDGNAARPGGTGDVVRLAGQYGIPVIRIDMDGLANPWVHEEGADEATPGHRAGLDTLDRHFERVLMAPAPDAVAHSAPDLREVYFKEGPRRERLGRIYDWFFNLVAPRGTPEGTAARKARGTAPGAGASPDLPDEDHVARLEAKWRREWTSQGACGGLCSALLESAIHKHYAWASHLANYYGGMYRSAFFVNYMFAWLAVASAAVGLLFHYLHPEDHAVILTAAGLEVGLLLGIIIIVWRSKRGRFHSRWLDYRRLAELIRSLPMLLPLSRTPVRRVESGAVFATQETWVEWMFRAVVRETGVLPIDITQHLAGARGILAEGILAGQIAYHRRTALRNTAVDRMLHVVTTWIFILALFLALIHVAEVALEMAGRVVLPRFFPGERTWLASWLALPALVLPALGAALHGLRSQGDYELTATRSEHIGQHLEELQKELASYPDPGVSQVAEIATETATAMNAELSAWLMAYQRKGIGLV